MSIKIYSILLAVHFCEATFGFLFLDLSLANTVRQLLPFLRGLASGDLLIFLLLSQDRILYCITIFINTGALGGLRHLDRSVEFCWSASSPILFTRPSSLLHSLFHYFYINVYIFYLMELLWLNGGAPFLSILVAFNLPAPCAEIFLYKPFLF